MEHKTAAVQRIGRLDYKYSSTMSCNCNNGSTYVNTCIPVPGATAEDATYVIELTHFLCGNRKVCANSAFPIAANLNYQVLSVQDVGNGAYNANIFITGQVSYKPYRSGYNGGCECEDNCYRNDNVWATVSVPVTTADAPLITAGVTNCAATNLRDCCSVSNAVSIVTSFNVGTKSAGASANPNTTTRSGK